MNRWDSQCSIIFCITCCPLISRIHCSPSNVFRIFFDRLYKCTIHICSWTLLPTFVFYLTLRSGISYNFIQFFFNHCSSNHKWYTKCQMCFTFLWHFSFFSHFCNIQNIDIHVIYRISNIISMHSVTYYFFWVQNNFPLLFSNFPL